MRRARTLPVLADNGVLGRGTIIEVVPDALPSDATAQDPRAFRARIDNPRGLRESVVWELDNQPYSLTELTYRHQEDYGVACLEHYIFKHWQIAGHAQSLWEEAERFPR
jgi:hypothetical protein